MPPPQPQPEQQHSSDLATVQALLGPEITAWSFSDSSFQAALELRTEQERTRQEYYRLEIRKKTSELLADAMRYNIPPSLMPLLFNDPEHTDANHQPSYAYPPQHPVPTSSFPSSSKNVPYDALGLNQSSPGHHRNMSMPQQPTIIQSEYQLRQQPPPPPPQHPRQKFRPTHGSHASMSAIPSYPSQSPAYQRQWHPAPYLAPPPAVNSQANAEHPGTGMHHLIQFHHWQPNQPKPSPSPKKESSGDSEETQSAKRRRSSIINTAADRSSSPTPKPRAESSASSMAQASAAAHSRRRSMHQRHKSETALPRTSELSPTFNFPPNSNSTTTTANSSKSSSSAAEGTAEGDDVTMSEAPHQEEQRRDKQGVHFMISDHAKK